MEVISARGRLDGTPTLLGVDLLKESEDVGAGEVPFPVVMGLTGKRVVKCGEVAAGQGFVPEEIHEEIESELCGAGAAVAPLVAMGAGV
jgi:hypothetical protein